MDPALALEKEAVSRHRDVEQLIDRGESVVQQFYTDAVVFLTGGSGFLGKQFILKLLRSTKLKKIYVLLRTKKQKTFEQRITEITNGPAFEDLHKRQPGFVDKIKAVAGDISELRLGLSDEDWNQLTEEVTIIVHMAATTNFNEPIKKASLSNVRGTREMLTLGKACKRLRSYVHVSTAFAHATTTRIEQPVLEEFYQCPVSPHTMIHFVEDVDQKVLDNITPELVKPWPNTYTFTKAIAEELVRTMGADLPICIVRPSIVIPAQQEPMPGWVDPSNVYGPSGVYLGIQTGVAHLIHGDYDAQIDFVPVDFVNNAIIAAVHETAVSRERGDQNKDIKIYNVVSQRNPIQLGILQEAIVYASQFISSDKAIWYMFSHTIKNRTIHTMSFWFYHFIPAYLFDIVLKIMGKKPITVKLYDKMNKVSNLYSYFLSNSWKFGDSNLQELRKKMSPTDQLIYQYDIKTVDWKKLFALWGVGTRKYLLKDGLNNSRYALKKQKYLRIAQYTLMPLYIYTLWKVFCLPYWALMSMFRFLKKRAFFLTG